MHQLRSGALCLLAAGLLGLLPVTARDLPFAPPRPAPKKPTNPIVFIPLANEAVTARLDIGWTLGDQINEPKKLVVMKFVPPDGNDEWSTKMINFASYLSLPEKESAHDFMDEARKSAEKMAPKGTLNWDVIQDTPTDCIYELSIKGWEDQFEMERVIKGRDGMHAVIYHLSTPDVADAERQRILTWLKSVKIRSKADFIGAAPNGQTK